MGKGATFPLIVRVGSAVVRIYRQQRPGERGRAAREFFSVSWHVGGVRKLKQCANLDEARAEAKLKAEALAGGRSEAAVTLAMDDVAMLSEIRRLAGGVPPVAAMEEWRRARDLTDGEIIPAAEAWRSRHAKMLESVTVAEAVKRFLAAQTTAGYATERTQGSIFAALAGSALGQQSIADITSTAIQNYLDEIPNLTSRYTHRKRLVTLWRWARGADLLPRDAQTEAERTRSPKLGAMKKGIIEAGVLAQWLKIVRDESPTDLPALVLSAFCGLRRSEVHGQRWEHVNLGEGHLHVTAAKEGTPAERLVPLCPAAVRWLALSAERTGLVCDGVAVDRVRKLGKERGLELPENCTRHSWISYRVAETSNMEATALEAGNSSAIIRKHYRKLKTAAQAAEWFAVAPST